MRRFDDLTLILALATGFGCGIVTTLGIPAIVATLIVGAVFIRRFWQQLEPPDAW